MDEHVNEPVPGVDRPWDWPVGDSAGRIEGGWLTVARTRLGRRAFVGNSAVVPGGVELGDGSLVGVLSLAPALNSESAKPGATWLGSPPLLLPRREASTGFSRISIDAHTAASAAVVTAMGWRRRAATRPVPDGCCLVRPSPIPNTTPPTAPATICSPNADR